MMKKNRSYLMLLTTIFLFGMFSSSALAFSGSDPEGAPGEPPKGLAISSDAPGIKLTGVLVIEYINWYLDSNVIHPSDYADMARVVLRLRKGNIIKIFQDEIPGPLSPSKEPLVAQQMIMDKMMSEVLDTFFPDADVEAKVKSLTNFTWTYGSPFLPQIAIMPGYGTCEENVLACDPVNDVWCDPGDPSLYITTCQGNYEFCDNGIDDDGDLKVDAGDGRIEDPDCLKKSGYTVTDIDISVK